MGNNEQSATRRQADIDSGKEAIVGVNKYRLEKEEALEVRKIDNSAVLRAQCDKLARLRVRDASDPLSVLLLFFVLLLLLCEIRLLLSVC
jgi:methylmalonyl-CoA mutase